MRTTGSRARSRWLPSARVGVINGSSEADRRRLVGCAARGRTGRRPSRARGGRERMSEHFEIIEHEGNDPRFNMPYVPAIKVHRGKTVYVSGVTAAPVYHSHPHVPAEFDD